jgi:small GTP-binding protein
MEPNKVSIFGLDRAGKTVLSNFLQKGQVATNFNPTLAVSMLSIVFGKVSFKIWDNPGQIKFRHLWVKNVEKSKVLIYVLDTSDAARFQESKDEFKKVVADITKVEVPLFFVFNKMDLPESKANLEKAKEMFNLQNVLARNVKVFETTIKDPKSIETLKNAIIDCFSVV